MTVRVARSPQWSSIRSLRLWALRSEPQFFAGVYEEEAQWRRMKWRRIANRYTWVLAFARDLPVGIARVVGPPEERFLESVWVRPGFRRRGIAMRLVEFVVERERDAGTGHLYAWIIEGNDGALRLYEQAGFSPAGKRSLLDEGRWEVLLQRRLAEDRRDS